MVHGAQQGIALTAQVLLNPGEAVWMEDPGYVGAKGALLGLVSGLSLYPSTPKGWMWKPGKRAVPRRAWRLSPPLSMPPGDHHELTTAPGVAGMGPRGGGLPSSTTSGDLG